MIQIAILGIVAGFFMFGTFGYAFVLLLIDMFRKRDITGIVMYDAGPKYEMSTWFEPLDGESFYGYK